MADTNQGTTQISLVIDVDLLADVDKAAKQNNRSRAGEIREALQRHIRRPDRAPLDTDQDDA